MTDIKTLSPVNPFPRTKTYRQTRCAANCFVQSAVNCDQRAFTTAIWCLYQHNYYRYITIIFISGAVPSSYCQCGLSPPSRLPQSHRRLTQYQPDCVPDWRSFDTHFFRARITIQVMCGWGVSATRPATPGVPPAPSPVTLPQCWESSANYFFVIASLCLTVPVITHRPDAHFGSTEWICIGAMGGVIIVAKQVRSGHKVTDNGGTRRLSQPRMPWCGGIQLIVRESGSDVTRTERELNLSVGRHATNFTEYIYH